MCHFASHATYELIVSGVGLRASDQGQLGGGLSVCKSSPHKLGWEQWGGGRWREGVGKALWGSKWQDVCATPLETRLISMGPALLVSLGPRRLPSP